MIKQKADSCPERVCIQNQQQPRLCKEPNHYKCMKGEKTGQMSVDISVKSQTPHESNSQVVSGSVFLFSFDMTHLKLPPDFYNWTSVSSNPGFYTSHRQILLKAGFSSLFHPHLEVRFWNDWTLSGKHHHHWRAGPRQAKQNLFRNHCKPVRGWAEPHINQRNPLWKDKTVSRW